MSTIAEFIRAIRHRFRLAAIILFLTAVFCLTYNLFAETNKTAIYFYSSETNVNNFKLLKMEFDRYLSAFGPYEFQPFSDRETFEGHLKQKKGILILSSWHYRNIFQPYSLKCALVGVRDQQKYLKRVLVARGEEATVPTTKTGRIASASGIDHTCHELSTIFREPISAQTVNILTVPKDIDALMSVGFGMSNAALATKNALEDLRKVNPSLYQKLRILAEGEESLQLVVAVPEEPEPGAEKLVNIIKNMSVDARGLEKLKMLGLDGWQPLDPADKARLEAQ